MPPLWVQLWSFHSSRFYYLTSSGLWVWAQGLPWCALSPVPQVWSQVPPRCALSLIPQMCARRCALSPVLWIWAQCPPTAPQEHQVGGWVERRLELLLQENSPNCPRGGLLLFEKILLLNPAAPCKEGPVLSHSPPLQLDWGLSGSGPHTAQLSTLPSQCPQSLCVYHFVLLPLPATLSNQVSLGAAQALFGRRESH